MTHNNYIYIAVMALVSHQAKMAFIGTKKMKEFIF